MPILTPEERVGQVVAARYRLEAVLSIGGMGVLFRALDIERGRPAAVKMLKPLHTIESDRVARFARETRIAQQLQHPNVARTLDAFTDEQGVPFLVMELLEGRTLAQELDERGTLPLSETLAIVVPIVHALEAAHALGVIHRDLKPSNIFVCRGANGCITPKLLDFGIAKGPEDSFETETGMLLGTPGYMAPEQLQYGECSALTDVWGIGAVVYRCLAGHTPHAHGKASELLSKLVREPVPPLSAPGVGKQVCATIDRALARDPHRRYASMQAFGRALSIFAADDRTLAEKIALPAHADHPSQLEPVARQRVRGRRSSSPLVLGALLIVLALGAVSSGTAEHKRPSADPGTDAHATHEAPVVLAPQAQPVPEVEFAQIAPVAPPKPVRNALRARPRLANGAPATNASKPGLALEREPTTGLPVATEW